MGALHSHMFECQAGNPQQSQVALHACQATSTSQWASTTPVNPPKVNYKSTPAAKSIDFQNLTHNVIALQMMPTASVTCASLLAGAT